MPLCPQCQKPLAALAPYCPSCKADLDLLVEYVGTLDSGLRRAEGMVRAGELDAAVWAYLEVLEVDPDNPEARRQVGRVATAVRAFDRLAPGRRWLGELRGASEEEPNRVTRWLRWVLILLLVAVAFAIGYGVGSQDGAEPSPPQSREQEQPLVPQDLKKDNQLGR